ncbi:MAG: J domain-containing protein, partial [Anaerolineae bacterium]|nr:J domain-containing protein [Anaerolineae bacterium]
IQFDSMQLFFLPDQVYVFQGGRYGAVSYNTLKAGVSSTRFIETETVPSDATVVDRTWRYVRKDGGPDMRFRNNRQIPVVEYGHIELSLQPETTLHLYVSSLERVRQFGDALHDYQRHCRNLAGSAARTDKQPKQRPKAKVSNESKDESPYAILNVSPSASKEEIVAAYRQAAKMWHPDRVAGLAPEFRELAEKRMKAVNAAYETLMRRTSAE